MMQYNQISPSFTPRINKVSKKKAGGNRFVKLYEDAAVSRRHKEIQAMESFERDKNLTFQPRTNRQRNKSLNVKSGKERLEDLYLHGKEMRERLENTRKMLEKNLDFKPRTNSHINKSLPSRSLYVDREEQLRIQRHREMLKEEAEMAECTFKPNVRNTEKGRHPMISPVRSPSSRSSGEDIYSRLYDQAKELRERRQQLELDAELLQASKRTKSISGNENHVFSRLYENARDWNKKKKIEEDISNKKRAEQEWLSNEKECTYHPRITTSPPYLHNQSISGSSDNSWRSISDPYTRLHEDAHARIGRRESEAQERAGLDMQCTFHPKINNYNLKAHGNTYDDDGESADNNITGHLNPTQVYEDDIVENIDSEEVVDVSVLPKHQLVDNFVKDDGDSYQNAYEQEQANREKVKVAEETEKVAGSNQREDDNTSDSDLSSDEDPTFAKRRLASWNSDEESDG